MGIIASLATATFTIWPMISRPLLGVPSARVDGACGDQDGPNLHGSWTQHVASYWAQRTPNTLGPPNQHEVLTAFADRRAFGY